MSEEVEAFTVAELLATKTAGHGWWYDAYCECWPKSEYSNDAPLFDVEHLIDVMRAARC